MENFIIQNIEWLATSMVVIIGWAVRAEFRSRKNSDDIKELKASKGQFYTCIDGLKKDMHEGFKEVNAAINKLIGIEEGKRRAQEEKD